MDFTLRHASTADIDAVMALETAGFPPGIVEVRDVFIQRLKDFPEGFFLAVSEFGRPVGYFCSEIWAGWENSDHRRFDLGHDLRDWLVPTGDTLYVASMTVDPAYRGLNLGRHLFHQSLATMKTTYPALKQVVLIVNEYWEAARKIYASEGFSEVGRLDGFFQPVGCTPSAAVLMVRNGF